MRGSSILRERLMDSYFSRSCIAALFVFTLSIAAVTRAAGQQNDPMAAQPVLVAGASSSALPDAPDPAPPQQASPAANPAAAQDPSPSAQGHQTKRILGIVPNFRSVSVDTHLPPLSAKDKLKLTLQDSFDYSSFIFSGVLAGVSQAEGSYPEFHQGAAGYARYYWHTFADTLGGNIMTEFAVPALTREDPRYYTLGHGNVFKRGTYSVSRLLITRTDSGSPTPNLSEIVGNGAAAGLSTLYYPSKYRTWTKTGQKWLTQVALDGVSNLVKEFWPDVNSRIFHQKY